MKVAKVLAMLAVGAALSLTLQSCAKDVQSSVNTYSKMMTEEYRGKTIAIVPMTRDVSGAQFEDFAGRLATRLTTLGFKVVPATDSPIPDYVAALNYGIDNGTQKTSIATMPRYGYSPVGTSSPSYNITGYATTDKTTTVYARFLSLDIWKPESRDVGAKVFEGNVKSGGTCADFGKVVDPMMDSILDGFPRSRKGEISKPLPGKC